MRRRRRPHQGIAACRPAADAGRGVSARNPGPGRHAAVLMPRYKLTIEYDGTPFVGWQIQDNGASVQGRITEAVRAFSGEDVVVRGAGRTDAGVHAIGQVAHLDLATPRDAETVRDAINSHLRPDPIAVLAAETAADDFD